MSTKFPPAILGLEMAAPILWAPGIFWFFLLENPHAHKIPPFRGGGSGLFEKGGGGSANFNFLGAGIFPTETGFSKFLGVGLGVPNLAVIFLQNHKRYNVTRF